MIITKKLGVSTISTSACRNFARSKATVATSANVALMRGKRLRAEDEEKKAPPPDEEEEEEERAAEGGEDEEEKAPPPEQDDEEERAAEDEEEEEPMPPKREEDKERLWEGVGSSTRVDFSGAVNKRW